MIVLCVCTVVDVICVTDIVDVTGCLVELSALPVLLDVPVVLCVCSVVDGICVALVAVTGCSVKSSVDFPVVLCVVDSICVTVVVAVTRCFVELLVLGSSVVVGVVGHPCSSSPSGQSTYTSQTCSFLIHFPLLSHRHSLELLQGHLSSSSPNEQSL